jgi:hypothetical protein
MDFTTLRQALEKIYISPELVIRFQAIIKKHTGQEVVDADHVFELVKTLSEPEFNKLLQLVLALSDSNQMSQDEFQETVLSESNVVHDLKPTFEQNEVASSTLESKPVDEDNNNLENQSTTSVQVEESQTFEQNEVVASTLESKPSEENTLQVDSDSKPTETQSDGKEDDKSIESESTDVGEEQDYKLENLPTCELPETQAETSKVAEVEEKSEDQTSEALEFEQVQTEVPDLEEQETPNPTQEMTDDLEDHKRKREDDEEDNEQDQKSAKKEEL